MTTLKAILLLFLTLAAGIVAACSSTVPAPEPARLPPIQAVDSTPPTARITWVLRPQSGTYRYEIWNEAIVEIIDSTKTQNPTRGGDTRRVPVSTRAVVTLALTPLGSNIRITGVVDSFTVARTELIPPPTDSVTSSTEFTASFDTDGYLTEFSGSPTSACDSPLDPLLGAAREALVPIPRSFSIGSMWHDSSLITTCRGGITIETMTVREYRIDGEGTSNDIPSIRVGRTVSITLKGTGMEHGQALTLTGDGLGRATLHVDATTGTLLDLTGESELTFSVGTPRSQIPFRQHVRQSIRRVTEPFAR